jgi:hypothetical protein
LNPPHRPVVVNGDEIERQMLTERDCHLHAIAHQVPDHLPKALVTFVLCVMSHPSPSCLNSAS